MSEFSRWLSRRNPQYFVEQQGGIMPPMQQNPTAPPAQTPAEKLRQRLERDKQNKTPHHIDPVTGNTVMRIQPIRQYLKQNQTPNQPPVKPDLQQKQNPYQPPVTPAPKNADMKNLKIQDIYSKQKYTPQLFSLYYPNFENIEEVLLNNIRSKGGTDELNDEDITYLIIGITDGTFNAKNSNQKKVYDRLFPFLWVETIIELSKRPNLPNNVKTNFIKKLSIQEILDDIKKFLNHQAVNEILSIYIKAKGGVEKLNIDPPNQDDISPLAIGVRNGTFDKSFLPYELAEKMLTKTRIKDTDAEEALNEFLNRRRDLSDDEINKIKDIEYIYRNIKDDIQKNELLNQYIESKGGVEKLTANDLHFLCVGIQNEQFDKDILSREEAANIFNRKDITYRTKEILNQLKNSGATKEESDKYKSTIKGDIEGWKSGKYGYNLFPPRRSTKFGGPMP